MDGKLKVKELFYIHRRAYFNGSTLGMSISWDLHCKVDIRFGTSSGLVYPKNDLVYRFATYIEAKQLLEAPKGVWVKA